MKAILIENGKPSIIEDNIRYFTDFAKKYLGENVTVERVHLSNNQTLFMAVDEDGIQKRLPLNFFMEMSNPFYPIQAIVGKAIVIRVNKVDWNKGEIYDFEVTNVTEEDIVKVNRLLDEEYLISLAMKFYKKHI